MDDSQKKFYPLKMTDVEPEVAKELMEYFTGEHTGFVRVGPKGYFFPHKFRQESANIYHMPLRADDIFVASYPRSAQKRNIIIFDSEEQETQTPLPIKKTRTSDSTTWTQELVWMVANDLDYAKSDAVPLFQRYSFLEGSTLIHPVMIERFMKENRHSQANLKMLKFLGEPGMLKLARVPSPRFIKTHLPVSLLPPALLDTAKMVYVARDPRDVAVSFYHHNRLYRDEGYVGDFKTYWNYFIRDLICCTPYFEQLKEAWEKRQHPNMLFLFYEELKKDLPAAVCRVAKFLSKELSSDQISKLCDHLSIDNFRNNKSFDLSVLEGLGIAVVGEEGFIRKGKAGGWRDYFNEEMSAQAEQWMARNLNDTDLRFPHTH